jgi:hypothetical protein
MRRSISASAGEGGTLGAAALRAGALAAAVGFLRRAADFFVAGFPLRAAAFFFATGRFGAFFPLAFAAERREADFFLAAMVSS